MESLQIYLNSSNANFYIGGSKSYCEWVLPQIEIPDGFHIYLSVQNCVIPYSFYNISSSNNTLIYVINSTNYNISIPIGNYNINQMIAALLLLMPGFTITYNNINNTLTFNYSQDFQFNSNSTILP